MKKISLTILTAISLISCAPKQMYYWGNYSKSYYKSVKNPGEETTQERFKTLEEIITKTEKSSTKRIGPGIYAEYGYMLIQMGEIEKGNSFLQKEIATFPEGSTTVQFITPKK